LTLLAVLQTVPFRYLFEFGCGFDEFTLTAALVDEGGRISMDRIIALAPWP
jgi:hypothetical protein